MKFDEFVSKTKTEPERPEGVAISGTFGCQSCFDMVPEAEYFQMEKILRWKCQNGHISYIENWVL